MDLFNAQGKKIGYTDKSGKSIMFAENAAAPATDYKKFESKSSAELNVVRPKKDQNFEPFDTIFAWKTSKRFGLINVNARKMKEQTKMDGSDVKDGFEKWVIKIKTALSEDVAYGIYNTRKGMLTFKFGTSTMMANHKKGYLMFITKKK